MFKKENFSAVGTAAALAILMLSSTACQSSFVRAVTFWRQPPAAPNAGDPVRDAFQNQTFQNQAFQNQAFQNQTQGAYDPRTGGPVQSLESRLKLSPQDAALHVDLGRAYENYSIDDLALEQFTRALNLDPGSVDALQGLTRLARKHPEQLAELVPVARAFLEHHPGNAAVLSTVGSLLDDSGDLAAAEKLYRQAIDLEPAAPWLHNNLGFNLLLQGRLADAAAELRRSLKLNPTSTVARNNLGVALARQGDRAGALKVFEETGADRATAHNNLGVALMEQDRLEESRAELMEALKAKNFFAPALENFKLLLEKDQDRLEMLEARPFQSSSLPAPRQWMRPPALPVVNQPEEPRNNP